MDFPEEYTKKGVFKLHSGGVSTVFYDVNALLTDKQYLDSINEKIPFSSHYIGIATGGAILAGIIAEKKKVKFSMVKDDELKGEIPKGEFVLIDDVCTTEGSFNEALAILKKNSLVPRELFCVMDRRTTKNLDVTSVFQS